MSKYYIHNAYDEESRQQLMELPLDTVVIDFYADYAKHSGLILDEPMPCFVDKLEYMAEPEPKPTPQEKIISLLEVVRQYNLDRDELQIDAALKMEEIRLSIELENANKFSGGGYYRLTCNPLPASVWGCAA